MSPDPSQYMKTQPTPPFDGVLLCVYL